MTLPSREWSDPNIGPNATRKLTTRCRLRLLGTAEFRPARARTWGGWDCQEYQFGSVERIVLVLVVPPPKSYVHLRRIPSHPISSPWSSATSPCCATQKVFGTKSSGKFSSANVFGPALPHTLSERTKTRFYFHGTCVSSSFGRPFGLGRPVVAVFRCPWLQ